MSEPDTGIIDSAKPMLRVEDNSVVPLFAAKEYMKDIYDLKIRDTDVTIVTWPKSGTTWSQYIMSQIVHGQEHVKEKIFLMEHVFLEIPQNIKDLSSDGRYKLAEGAPSPRFLKSHFLLRFLPHEIFEKRAKVIYVARNPKDAIVSYYNFCLANQMLPTYGWNEFIEQFTAGLLPFGDWFEHVLQFWEKKDEPNVLFIKYEDMKKDLKKVVNKMAVFLDKTLTDDEINEICKNSTFENMAANPKSNPDVILGAKKDWKKKEGSHVKFMRKGVVGDWKNWFTVAQSEMIDEIYKKKMKGSGLEFSFE
ncbi:sulfotransferase [Apostichopus japonicus]|uniref:Sulfotransferase n=1 Tax=Stichopus japonicus TaxID=307972 RepID=A0A2G8L585_STIJA|nr:sulfotransferase [Apostichopus japonicus]